MQNVLCDNTGKSCLRFVFNGTVVSCDIAENATFEDVAQRLGALDTKHYGDPIAIDITMGYRSKEKAHNT